MGPLVRLVKETGLRGLLKQLNRPLLKCFGVGNVQRRSHRVCASGVVTGDSTARLVEDAIDHLESELGLARVNRTDGPLQLKSRPKRIGMILRQLAKMRNRIAVTSGFDQ